MSGDARDDTAPAAEIEARLWDRPGFLIRRLHQIHVALFLEECRTFDVTPVQYAVMTALSIAPGRDQITLARDAGIDRTNAADVLKRLAQRGLIERRQGAADRRVKLAYLTQEGEALTKRMEAAMLRAQERLVAPLDEGDRARLMRSLAALVAANNEFSRAPTR
ncbi:MAG: MarR family transcriptional regulator [Defluviicoccus sp.]|nr:MarR family transcriptional regulator [Defluviicoccus sp.]MDE0278609.1 MarR family transcriptional regulator [Defluviicoccus sp.]